MKHMMRIFLALTLTLTVICGFVVPVPAEEAPATEETLYRIAVFYDADTLMADADFAEFRRDYGSNRAALEAWLAAGRARIEPIVKPYMTVEYTTAWRNTEAIAVGTATESQRAALATLPEVTEVCVYYGEAPESEGFSVMFGDLDLNGRVTAADARIALRASARLERLTAARFLAGDLNGDGQITAGEARKILRVSAKLERTPNFRVIE